MTDDQLLDKHGRPVRGAARTGTIATIERRAVRLAALAPSPTPASVAGHRSPSLARPALPAISVRTLRVAAMAMAITFVLATIIGTTGLVSQHGRIALGASTMLTIISGEVDLRASDADDFKPAEDGALLRAGMTVRTSADAYAVLTYFEGSTVSLDPSTTVVIAALGADPDGSTVISMEQQTGRTWHSVSKLLNPRSKYDVRTPTATATVRGTAFAVSIATDEQGELSSTVETTEGAVATAKLATVAEPQPAEVIVRPGSQVTVKRSAPLDQPTPIPEPERKVTVTVGASAGLVLDPIGRANGIKDGKVVRQTPGAVVRVEDGKVVVSLPDIPDGRIATVLDAKVSAQAPVDVVTTVDEKGAAEKKTEAKTDAAAAAAPPVIAVEVKKGADTKVAPTTDAGKKDIASRVKVAEPPRPAPAADTRPAESGGGNGQKKDERHDGGPGAPGGPPSGFAPVVGVRQLPTQHDQPKAPVDAATGGAPAKADSPKVDAPKVDARKPEAPKPEAPKPAVPQPVAPNVDPPKAEAPKPEAPKADVPKAEAPKAEAPKADGPREARDGFVPQLELPSLPFGGGPGGGGDRGGGGPGGGDGSGGGRSGSGGRGKP